MALSAASRQVVDPSAARFGTAISGRSWNSLPRNSRTPKLARLAFRVRGFRAVKVSSCEEPRISVTPPTLNVSTFLAPAFAVPSTVLPSAASSRNSIAEARLVKSSRFCRAVVARVALSSP